MFKELVSRKSSQLFEVGMIINHPCKSRKKARLGERKEVLQTTALS